MFGKKLVRSFVEIQRAFRKRRNAAITIQKAVKNFLYRPGGPVY